MEHADAEQKPAEVGEGAEHDDPVSSDAATYLAPLR
jgi:hypothetical protein